MNNKGTAGEFDLLSYKERVAQELLDILSKELDGYDLPYDKLQTSSRKAASVTEREVWKNVIYYSKLIDKIQGTGTGEVI